FMPALYDRADIYAELRRDPEALRDYEQIVKANPADAVARLKLGMVYHRTAQLDNAVAAYRAALAVNPNLAPAYNNLAMISLGSGGSVSEALSWARRAVQLA